MPKFRYERKFTSELRKHEVESIVKLNPEIFHEIFYERHVNNIYFDSNEMNNYFANEGGDNQRLKIRIRWYGNLFGMIKNPFLELKVKNGKVGTKLKYPLKNFKLGKDFSLEKFHKLLYESNIPERIIEELKKHNFSLLNRYARKYFINTDKTYRITIDSNLEFYSIMPRNNLFLEKISDYKTTVLELKYSNKDDKEVERITQYFPFNLTKISKYVLGIKLLNSLIPF